MRQFQKHLLLLTLVASLNLSITACRTLDPETSAAADLQSEVRSMGPQGIVIDQAWNEVIANWRGQAVTDAIDYVQRQFQEKFPNTNFETAAQRIRSDSRFEQEFENVVMGARDVIDAQRSIFGENQLTIEDLFPTGFIVAVSGGLFDGVEFEFGGRKWNPQFNALLVLVPRHQIKILPDGKIIRRWYFQPDVVIVASHRINNLQELRNFTSVSGLESLEQPGTSTAKPWNLGFGFVFGELRRPEDLRGVIWGGQGGLRGIGSQMGLGNSYKIFAVAREESIWKNVLAFAELRNSPTQHNFFTFHIGAAVGFKSVLERIQKAIGVAGEAFWGAEQPTTSREALEATREARRNGTARPVTEGEPNP